MHNPFDDQVFVLCATYNSADGDGNMYIAENQGGEPWPPGDNFVTKLGGAKLFETHSDAWYHKEHVCQSNGWQVAPFSRKRVFEARLAGE